MLLGFFVKRTVNDVVALFDNIANALDKIADEGEWEYENLKEAAAKHLERAEHEVAPEIARARNIANKIRALL